MRLIDDIVDEYKNGTLSKEMAEMEARLIITEYEVMYPDWSEDLPDFDGEMEIEKAKTFLEHVHCKGTETISEKHTTIMWKGKVSDIARLYRELIKAGLIDIKARDFSTHFCLKDGKDLPLDFIENMGTNQNDNSPKQEVMKVQSLIRGMKPEPVE